jgi:hypothetical protein
MGFPVSSIQEATAKIDIDGLNLPVIDLLPEAPGASSEAVWHQYRSTTAPQVIGNTRAL